MAACRLVERLGTGRRRTCRRSSCEPRCSGTSSGSRTRAFRSRAGCCGCWRPDAGWSHRRDGHRLRRRARVVGERRGRGDDRSSRSSVTRNWPTRAAELFAEHPNVTVVRGDWSEVLAHAPFDLLVLDGGGAAKHDDAIDPADRAGAGRDAGDRRLHAGGRVAAACSRAARMRRGCTGSSIRCCRRPRSGRRRRARRSSRRGAGSQAPSHRLTFDPARRLYRRTRDHLHDRPGRRAQRVQRFGASLLRGNRAHRARHPNRRRATASTTTTR